MEVSWLWLCVKKKEIWLRSRYMVWRVSKSVLTSVKAELWLNLKGTPEAVSQILASVWDSDASEWLYQSSLPRSLHQTELHFIPNHNKIWFLNADNHTSKFFLSEFRLKSDRNLVKWTNKSDILGYLTDRTRLSRDLETAFTSVSWV